MKTRLLLFVCVQLFISSFLLGQAPDRFNYQAVLRDVSGNVRANVNVNIEISILQGSAAGTAVYIETHAATTNAFGLVNLQIGGGVVTSGTFASIDWAAGPYFVKIKVDGTEFGTSQLISVPYAKYADKAGNGFSGNFPDLTNKPTTVAGYGITDAVTTSGNQTVSGVKTFSSTIKADSLSLTKKTTKWVFNSHSFSPLSFSAGLSVVHNPGNVSFEASTTGDKNVYLYLSSLPCQVLGNVQKIKSITIRYLCASAQAYITSLELVKVTTGYIPIISSTDDLTSTSAADYTKTLSTSIAFDEAPLHLLCRFTFNGTGTVNAIQIYKVIITTD